MSELNTTMAQKKRKQQEYASEEEEYISKEGYEALRQELEELKNERRVEIAQKLKFAKSLGDLSENAEYNQAKEEHTINEAKIAQLEDFLSRATIIKKPPPADRVGVGSTVIVSIKMGLERYTIVGTHEVDIATGKVSNESPFGKAFLGKIKKDTVVVRTPKGNIEYSIVDIC